MAVRKYALRKNPVARVEIDGTAYDVELGNITFAVEASRWQTSLQAVASGKTDPKKLGARFARLAKEGHDLVASLMGDKAADELVGGRNALNLYRLVDVMNILADIVNSDESREAMRALAAAAATADED